MKPLALLVLLLMSIGPWGRVLAAVDANTASAADLESIAGIGPATAAKIVEARASGPFADADDLQRRVKGIGARSIVKMQAAGLVIPAARRQPARAETPAQPEIIMGRPVAERTMPPAKACTTPDAPRPGVRLQQSTHRARNRLPA